MAEKDQDEIKALRQHVEDMFAMHAVVHELEGRALILAKQNSDESLKTALEAMNRRLEGMNEFRASLTEITNKAVGRDEWAKSHKELDEKYDTRFQAISDKYDSRFSNIEKSLSDLRSDVIQSGAVQRGGHLVKDEGRANLITIISAIGVVLALGTAGISVLLYILSRLPSVHP